MFIKYAQNPLETTVELDDSDRNTLRLKIVIQEHEERLADAAFHVKAERLDVERVRAALDWKEWCGGEFDAFVEERMATVENELLGAHAGDCTCLPCSCVKCWAEDLIGTNTIMGLGKHSAHKIDAAFSGGAETAAQAIASLNCYKPARDGAWLRFPEAEFEAHVPRWRHEAAQAAAWLVGYEQRVLIGR